MKGYVASAAPEIDQKLKGKHDLTIQCLTVIRLKLPNSIVESSPDVQHDLVAVGAPFGLLYSTMEPYEPLLQMERDWIEMNERDNHWVLQAGPDNLINEVAKSHYINQTNYLEYQPFHHK